MRRAAILQQRVAEYFDATAEQWIGYSFPPVERSIAESGWKPDARESYCARCGDSVAPGEATDNGCATCRPNGELAGGIAGGVVRLGPYNAPLRSWILAIKFSRWAEMGDWLGRMLGRQIRDAGLIDLERAVIVPMPMPWQRRFYRGIDHAMTIAAGVGTELGVPTARILTRDNRPPQVSLPASQRRRRGSHGLRHRMGYRRWLGERKISGLDLVLVDDVRTTGSSLRAAARMLKRLKPANVICAVVAVADSKARRDRSHQADAASPAIAEPATQEAKKID